MLKKKKKEELMKKLRDLEEKQEKKKTDKKKAEKKKTDKKKAEKKKQDKKKPKKKKIMKPNKKDFEKICDFLINKFEGIVDKLTIEEEKYNDILKCMSDKNRKNIDEKNDFLYPILDDENFNKKIVTKKEFYDTKYNARPEEDYDNIEKITNELCSEREFELLPHQKFVRNFLSYKTPYNSLLLYHGVGSGKTCSSISVCEQMRLYSKQLKNSKRIIIVASPNVQENYKLQLFDERKLKNIDGNWNIKSCTGNTFIKEINPMNMKGLSRDKVIRQIKRIINNSYLFLGYLQFANWISNLIETHLRKNLNVNEKKILGLKKIKREFSNRMIVIDEVQNIRNTEDGTIKKTSENLIKLVKYSENMKLLLLSATPMFNQPEEIVWLLNLMNINDDSYAITEKDMFDTEGNLRIGKNGDEKGKELLIRKSTGYISYLRGENPFTFPFRLFPNDFKSPHSIKKIIRDDPNWYPNKQINDAEILDPINILDLYIKKLGSYQQMVYNFGEMVMKKKYTILKNKKRGIQYKILDPLIQVLNFSYPLFDENEEDFDSIIKKNSGKEQLLRILKKAYGKNGMKKCMYNKLVDIGMGKMKKRELDYKPDCLKKYGRIFSPEELPKYSGKISSICKSVKESKGIVLIYSQFIDGGCVPIALALEEMGFKRYGSNKSLFKSNEVEPLDAKTMEPRGEGKFNQANYIMITGDKILSPDNSLELLAATNENNLNGEIVKVVIVSKAGSEGLDFKNIRQVHILEPWYNINRIEQIIGRGVRNLGHCLLPFVERNVEIYLYGSELEENEIEAIDLYMYRLAENKAKKIGIVSRIIKENAIDCLLNQSYNKIDIDKMIQISTSSNQKIELNLKDRKNTSLCDYMDDCNYNCIPNIEINEGDIKSDTYDETFITMNIDKILYRIKMLFKEKYVYSKDELILSINAQKFYPNDQIYIALNQLLEDENEFITDMLGRIGKLVVIGDFYMFKPLELDNNEITLFERKVPMDYKRKELEFILPDKIGDQILLEDDEMDDENVYRNIYTKMEEDYMILNGKPMGLKNKKNSWTHNCVWTIYNLNKFNSEFERNILIKVAIFHKLDIMNVNEKIEIANNIYFKDDLTELEEIMKEYFDMFIIDDVLLCLYDEESDMPYIQLFKDENKWSDKSKITQELKEKYETKFVYVTKKGENDIDIGKLNKLIGFMIYDERYKIIYKTKDLKMNSNRRIKKGKFCEKGQTKDGLTAVINKLLTEKNGRKKYTLGNKLGKKNKLVNIYEYEYEDIIFYPTNESGEKLKKSKVTISTLQLCIEIELIFRYYNYKKKDDKIWFLSELESNFNKIETVGI